MERSSSPLSQRQLVVDLLGRLHPNVDLSDEEVLFGLILDDYEAYAQVLDDQATPSPPPPADPDNNPTDDFPIHEEPCPLPDLKGVNMVFASRTSSSIFDIARGL